MDLLKIANTAGKRLSPACQDSPSACPSRTARAFQRCASQSLRRGVRVWLTALVLLPKCRGADVGAFPVLASGPRPRPDLRLDWHLHHWHWLLPLSKMGRLMPFTAGRGWASWALWTGGVTLRWVANVSEWNWRLLLPTSAALQLMGFLSFFCA